MNAHIAVKSLAICAFLALAACGQSEEPQSSEPEPIAEIEPTEEPAATGTEEAAEEAVQSVVEESAADAEPEDQTIVLAQAETKPSQQNFKYREGTHFTRLVPTQPTVGGSADKVEVAEFFWYGCPHCYDLEPFLNRWKETKPANVRFVQVPVSWNRQVATHAQMFYAAEYLVDNGVIEDSARFQQAVFSELHQRGNRLLSESAMKSLFASFGASGEQFDEAWGSFDVDRKLKIASDFARRYSIQSVPAVVVNGKYRTSAQSAGGNAELIEVIDELIARETIR